MSLKPKIPHNKPVVKLSQRIAEEAQLLAEEKWIIEALKKIKAQRNGLQIERLHLESMRAKLLAKLSKDQAEGATASQTMNPTVGTTDMPIDTIHQNNTSDDMRLTTDMEEDEICNNEELNLSVTNSVFNTNPFGPTIDEEEDDEDMDNCLLDIDLLMSGK